MKDVEDVAAAFFLNELLCFLGTFFVSSLNVVFIIILLVFFCITSSIVPSVHQYKFASLLFYSFSFWFFGEYSFRFLRFPSLLLSVFKGHITFVSIPLALYFSAYFVISMFLSCLVLSFFVQFSSSRIDYGIRLIIATFTASFSFCNLRIFGIKEQNKNNALEQRILDRYRLLKLSQRKTKVECGSLITTEVSNNGYFYLLPT